MIETSSHIIDAEECIGNIPEWGHEIASALKEKLASHQDPFPCTMAVAANKKRALRFGFVEDLFDSATWESTPGVLDAYIARHQSLGRQTSLVLFFKPTYVAHTIDDYYDRFWAVLQHLHDNDKQPWPEDLPVDPENPRWQFAYGGCAFFVVCSTPAHSLRRSRSNPGFLITFQPHRWVFEGLGGDTPRGISVRRTIRERLRRYDGIVPSSLLGVYGDDSNKEWQQYFLPDSDHGSWGACPFSGQGSSGLVEISSPGMPDDRQPPS